MREGFILHDDRMFTPVRVGAEIGYAYLNSGARYSSVRGALAGFYPQVGRPRMHGMSGTAEAFQVRLDSFNFLGEIFHERVVGVLPETGGSFEQLPFPVLLALGCDVLLQRGIILDFLRQEVSFLSRETLPLPATERLAVDFSAGVPVFELHMAGKPLKALFDTGSGISMLNQQLAGDWGEILLKTGPLEIEDPAGARQQLRTYRSRELKIGKTRMRNCQFILTDFSAFAPRENLQVDFIFGVSGMPGRRWVIDVENGVLEMG